MNLTREEALFAAALDRPSPEDPQLGRRCRLVKAATRQNAFSLIRRAFNNGDEVPLTSVKLDGQKSPGRVAAWAATDKATVPTATSGAGGTLR